MASVIKKPKRNAASARSAGSLACAHTSSRSCQSLRRRQTEEVGYAKECARWLGCVCLLSDSAHRIVECRTKPKLRFIPRAHALYTFLQQCACSGGLRRRLLAEIPADKMLYVARCMLRGRNLCGAERGRPPTTRRCSMKPASGTGRGGIASEQQRLWYRPLMWHVAAPLVRCMLHVCLLHVPGLSVACRQAGRSEQQCLPTEQPRTRRSASDRLCVCCLQRCRVPAALVLDGARSHEAPACEAHGCRATSILAMRAPHACLDVSGLGSSSEQLRYTPRC